jgi:hypothetical protein
MLEKETKCENCQKWTPGNLPNCTHCGYLLQKKYIESREQVAAQPDFEFPWIQIYPTDFWLVKGFKYVLRGGQAVFFGIVTVFAYIVASAAF